MHDSGAAVRDPGQARQQRRTGRHLTEDLPCGTFQDVSTQAGPPCHGSMEGAWGHPEVSPHAVWCPPTELCCRPLARSLGACVAAASNEYED